MHNKPFFASVRVASDGYPAGLDIENLEQALQFLHDWPAHRRGPVYLAAYNACRAAREGSLTVEQARKSLSGFASITRILHEGRRKAEGPLPEPGSPARHAH